MRVIRFETAGMGALVMDRRKFLRRAAWTSLGVGAGVYPFLEAKWCRVTRRTVVVPNLPPDFRGATVAVLADVHHGPFVPLAYVRRVVAMTNALEPDLVFLVGDYVHRSPSYIAPVMAELGRLRAGLGRFAVRGNHDNWESARLSKAGLAEAGIPELDNTGVWVERGRGRLRVCGVGDLWTDQQHLGSAVGDATDADAVLLLSHNPDFVETIHDRRVGLVFSGHTHGGQVVVPGYGAPIVPSAFGQKYLHGLVQGPTAKVFVSRGVGTVSPPVRFLCRPEVVLITLA